MEVDYHITDASRIEKLKLFLQFQDKAKKITLIYDDDADGVCSGTVLYQTLLRLGFSNISLFVTDYMKKNWLQDTIQTSAPDMVFMVDTEPQRFMPLEETDVLACNLIVIDHHFDHTVFFDDANLEYIRLFIHPNNTTNTSNASQYCCSKFVYDICMHLCDVRDLEWKIVPGMIGDMNMLTWDEYIRTLIVAKGDIEIDDSIDLWDTVYAKFVLLVSFSAHHSPESVMSIFEEYQNINSIVDVDFKEEYYEKEYKTYDLYVNSFRTFEEIDKESGIHFIDMSNNAGLTSLVSSVISYQHGEICFVFYGKKDGGYNMSYRSQTTDVHLGELAKDIASEFEGANAGGHKPAAGGRCKEADFPAFKKRFCEEYVKRVSED